MAEDLTYERRLDGLVAIHVLGWHLVFLDLGNVWADSAGGTRRRAISWAPTSDGNNMLAVIEAMQGRRYRLFLEWFPSRGTTYNMETQAERPTPLWVAASSRGSSVSGETTDYWRGRANADTAPMAVVLAALAALGIEAPAETGGDGSGEER